MPVRRRAGEFRHRLEVQRRVRGKDSQGGVVESYVLAGLRWAAILPMSAKEIVDAKQVNERASVEIRLSFFANLDATYRLVEKHTRRVWNIVGVRNEEEGDVVTVCTCTAEPTKVQPGQSALVQS